VPANTKTLMSESVPKQRRKFLIIGLTVIAVASDRYQFIFHAPGLKPPPLGGQLQRAFFCILYCVFALNL